MVDNNGGEGSRKKALKFLPEFRDKILSGEKVSTIRKGRVERYGEGEIVEVLAGDEVLGEAEIVRVAHRKFREISKNDAKKDGFKSKSELKKVLKKIYGKFKSDDVITQIEFRLIRQNSRHPKNS